jgi:pentose-5-phosphate-3-epimerase
MKISASIYSDKKRQLTEVIEDLMLHQVDMLHVDCNDDLTVFDDIALIRKQSSVPIDLHIISDNPEQYFDRLRATPVDYVTFQFESLKKPLLIPDDIEGKKGLAIVTPTNIDVFEEYSSFDFILIMATVPGQSGGEFDKNNFSKIRQFRKKYPLKSVHVDGGVNAEVSFILRNMGVSCSVSGSYLFNAPSIGHALMNLTKRNIESHFCVQDFMIPLDECPAVHWKNASLRTVLGTIENGNLGFCLCLNDDFTLKGIVSSADIRKAMIKNLDNLSLLGVEDLLNRTPMTIYETNTVAQLLEKIEKCKFPLMYLPVLSEENKAVGIVNFVNLIKGEL